VVTAMATRVGSTVDFEKLRPLDAAALVARVVELKSLRLGHIDATGPSDFAAFAKTMRGWEVSRPVAEHSFDENTKTLEVALTVGIRAFAEAEGSSEKEELAAVHACFLLDYKLTAEAPPQEGRRILFGGFAEINALHNAWPYFREIFQATTVRLGLPPVTLPTFRLPRDLGKPGPKRPSGVRRGRAGADHR